ncbi:unnamed protein product [Eruca vesicaria subsp. sativa]|uniref:Uncharacterized protein n=1 Tax=Eruca vesicaria subsp. sativa TaxID=29727 RepID=A0ABC8IYI1_ERUVS|nr:unnamed protein product [Eruca vesicaria subsp. sativa]
MKVSRRWRQGLIGRISSTGTFTPFSELPNGRFHSFSPSLLSYCFILDEFQRAVQSSYDNGLKGETRVRHSKCEFTFAMETQDVKIKKSHKEASEGTLRRFVWRR